MTPAAGSLWRSITVFSRFMLTTYALLAVGAGGCYLVQSWLADRARYDEWAADQRLEQRLNKTVEMKFAAEPTYDQWLAEWSRQAGVAIVHESHLGTEPFALQLQPMTAREALLTFCHTYDRRWSATATGIEVGKPAQELLLETRVYSIPLGRRDRLGWIDADLDWQKVESAPGSLQVTTDRHRHTLLENHFQRLSAAHDHAACLGRFTSASDPAWQPQFLETDPVAMRSALQLLDKRVTIDVANLPLRDFARQLSQMLNYPVLVDPQLGYPKPIYHDAPVTYRTRDLPLGQIQVPVKTYSIQIAPAASGHALLLVTDPDDEMYVPQYTAAYPVPDLVSAGPFPPGHSDPLEELVHGFPIRRAKGNFLVLENVLLVQATHSHHRRIQALLTAVREARSGMNGLVSRTHLAPETPADLAVLKEPAELVYVDVPLKNVLADLQQRFGLAIEIESFPQEVTAIWCHLPAQPLRDNLERMLAPYQLSLVIEGQRVQILPQFEALGLDDSRGYEFEAYNIRQLLRARRNGHPEIAELLLAFADDSDFRRTGGEGVLVPFQELLVARQRPAGLDRVRQVLSAIEPQALRSPRQVRADALANRSAPFFVDTGLWETPAAAALRKELQAKLDRPITISFEQQKPLTALLALARQYQLPIVHPGYQHAEVDAEREITFTARDEALADVLARFLPPDNTKQWLVGKDGTLQTWYPEFLPGSDARAARWLFDVFDLLQPAGPLLPGQLHRMLHASLPTATGFGLSRQHLHLGRFLEVNTKLQRDWFQHTLHELRTGKLEPILPIQGDEQENSAERFLPPERVEVDS